MRILIAEDDNISSRLLKTILSPLGECEVAIDGGKAFDAFRQAWIEGDPYDLICLDIMMPKTDGQEALQKIREMEREIGVIGSNEVKVIMITALGDPKTVVDSFYKAGTTSYIVKPVNKDALLNEIRRFGLIN